MTGSSIEDAFYSLGDFVITSKTIVVIISLLFVVKVIHSFFREQRRIWGYLLLLVFSICLFQLVKTSLLPFILNFTPLYKRVGWRFIPFYSSINYYHFYGQAATPALVIFLNHCVFASPLGFLQAIAFKNTSKVQKYILPFSICLGVLVKCIWDYFYVFDFGKIGLLLFGYFFSFWVGKIVNPKIKKIIWNEYEEKKDD